MCDSESMKTLLPLAALSALLSACGTGILPTVPYDLPDINATLPVPSTASPMVIYSTTDQFAALPVIAQAISSIDLTGDLVYNGKGAASTLSNVGIYIRDTVDGQNCYNQAGYLICSDTNMEESSHKLQDVPISIGVLKPVTLMGDVLNKSVKNRKGYIGFRINQGTIMAGDQINFTKIKATIHF
jgi:hypothetical protein